MKTERLIFLTSKECSENLTEKEQVELADIISKDEEYLEIYNELKEQWKRYGTFKLKDSGDVEASWEKFQTRISEKPSSRILRLHPIIKVAAAIIIAVSLSLVYLNPWATESYSTEIGEMLEITLDDESVISLNESSTLVVSSDFNDKKRHVEFTGEAYFDIAENPQKPFIIESGVIQVEVLGTSFNVNARKGEELVEVDVTSGRVSLSEVGKESNRIILTKGMTGIFNLNNFELSSTDFSNENFISWSSNILEFDDLMMSDVLKDISKHFKTEVFVENDAILSCNFTSSFSDATIEEVLDVIAITLDLSYTNEGNRLALSGQGCSEN